MTKGMPAVALLAGGRGTRLGPKSNSLPKSLVEARGEPFIAHQLRLLRDRGVSRVVVCLGYLGDLIREACGDGSAFGLSLDYSSDGPRPLGTAGAVKNALPLLGDVFFVLYGDSYLPCDFKTVLEAHRRQGLGGLMTVFRNDNRWDRSNVAYEDGSILAYDKEKPSARMRHIDYGLAVFRRTSFRWVPEDRFHDLSALYRKLIALRQLAAHEVGERFFEVGSPAGLRAFRRYLDGAQSGPGEQP